MIDPMLNAMRLFQAINGEQPDQVPVFLPIESGFMAEYGGVPQREYHNDPRRMLECQAKAQKRFNGLSPLYTDFGVVTEAAAFCEIFWPEDDSPWAKPAINSIDEVDNLSVPDTKRDGLFPRIMEYFEVMNAMALERGLQMGVGNPCGPVGFGSLRGPVVLAALIRGISEFMIDMFDKPDKCHQLLEIATETLLAYLDMQKRALGSLAAVFLCDDISGLLSPSLFKEFFLPYAARIFRTHSDALTIYHCDSEMHNLTELAPETGARAFHMGFMHDMARLKRTIGGRMCLIGNVAPVAVLMREGPERILHESRRCIEGAAAGGGFALSSGGVIDRGTPPENIDALVEASERFGKY
ncbi:uroporphyrinogen decarboxylase family protein [Candidatus Poribacteria bacterium]|nr:uroporphyrinogen decarboxylase family protein [Candidatus Poribacteria bacterium]